MKRFFFILLALFTLSSSHAVENGRFSLVTCSPGDEVYSLFGHTALRYVNEASGEDDVFSYGYFNFGSPNFVWRFVLGQTDYIIGAVPFEFFIEEYVERGSQVTEQVLNLTPSQVATLYTLLQENRRPHNRVYRYNYFYANCTTKARDKFVESLGEDCRIVYATDSALRLPTFREAIFVMTATHPWYAFGIDLLMGSDADKECTPDELQFVPGNLMNDFGKATLESAGVSVPAVTATNVLVSENRPQQPHSNFTPFNVALLLLVLTFIVQLCELRTKKTFWGFDILLMTLQGAAGCLLLFMGLFSEHPAVDANYAILILNPIALVIMPVMVYRIIKHKSMGIAWVMVAFALLFFIAGIAGLQSFPAPLYFCAAALLVRSLFHIYKKKICELDIV